MVPLAERGRINRGWVYTLANFVFIFDLRLKKGGKKPPFFLSALFPLWMFLIGIYKAVLILVVSSQKARVSSFY